MKKSDYIFWSVLAVIALFLLLKGNDIHRDYYKHIAEKAQHHSVKKPPSIEVTE